MKIMSKVTWKVLLRNPFFIFFGVAVVILGTLLLNISMSYQGTEKQNEIYELEGLDCQMAYLEDPEKFQVKVYDRCGDENTLAWLETLTESGMFQIFLVKSSSFEQEAVSEDAKYSALHDKVDAILILGPQFSEQLAGGKLTDGMTVYRTGEDDRYALFESMVRAKLLENMQNYAMEQVSECIGDSIPQASKKEIGVEELESSVTTEDFSVDYAKTTILGETLAIYTVAFLFTGVMILGTIITERENRVITRILLAGTSPYSYILAKFMVILGTSIMQTALATLTYTMLVKTSVGLSIGQFVCILLPLAIIFNSFSVGIGICCGNTLTACLVTFSIWMLSCLLGGLYFNINNSSETFQRIALLMPQRWGLVAATQFMNGNQNGYLLMLMVAVTYVSVILLIGVLGLRLKGNDNS